MDHATQQKDAEDPDPRPPSAAERFMRAVVRAFVLGAATAAGSSCVTLLIQIQFR
ncbi:hypothetical protein ACIG54_37450 [Streptomyces achromogenes]|uniref:hypothetical protein n=1 Tax=Streptomyces achromogenes TaxID=67255 RepID=UPI003430FA5E